MWYWTKWTTGISCSCPTSNRKNTNQTPNKPLFLKVRTNRCIIKKKKKYYHNHSILNYYHHHDYMSSIVYFQTYGTLPLPVDYQEEYWWDPIYWFDPATYLCLFHARIWISKVICRGVFGMGGDCSLMWYWWYYLPSLFELFLYICIYQSKLR
jgi:hypothetical protein